MGKGRKTIKELLLQYKETGVLPWSAGRRIEQNDATAVNNANLEAAKMPRMTDYERLQLNLALKLTYIGPNQNVPQQLQDYYRLKDETARWAAYKKAVEEATDEMMLDIIDPRYIVAGAAAGNAVKAVKGIVTGSKLYKSLKLSRAINKAVNTGISGAKDASEIVPGQVGWAPKTSIRGYHASNDEQLNPNFWFNGWAQQRGAPPGFYIARGKTPEGGFLAKRPHVHQIETEFEKPMVLIGDIPTRPGFKNSTRNKIERFARRMGADGIIYQDIADNQLKHLYITKTLSPDVQINTTKKVPSENMIDDYIKADKILGDYIDEGAEATVYTDPLDKRFVIKQKSGLVAPRTLEELRDNIIEDLLLNDLPGMEPLEYLGFTEVDNSYNTIKNGMRVRVPVKYFTPFYRQRKITPLIKMADPFHTLTESRLYTNDGLRKALIELGYTPTTKPGIYEFGRYPEIGDFSVGNVGVDDIGRLRVIDPMIHTGALLKRRIDLGYFK